MLASKLSECLRYRGKQGPRWHLGPGTEGRRGPVPRATEPMGDGNRCVSSFVLWLPDSQTERDHISR